MWCEKNTVLTKVLWYGGLLFVFMVGNYYVNQVGLETVATSDSATLLWILHVLLWKSRLNKVPLKGRSTHIIYAQASFRKIFLTYVKDIGK